MNQTLTGCSICGEDFEVGDTIRTWFARAAGHSASCHDACYLSLNTDPRRLAAVSPLITAAPVTVWSALCDCTDPTPIFGNVTQRWYDYDCGRDLASERVEAMS